MAQHTLKILPEFFAPILSGEKAFEIRKNDRNYQKDDVLILCEYDDVDEVYTGRAICVKVTYLLNGGRFGLNEDHVIMSILKI